MVNKGLKIFFITTIIVAILDQGSKALLVSRMGLNTARAVIPGLFNIVYLRNTGSAFGIMGGSSSIKTVLISILTIGAIIVIAFMVRRNRGPLHAFALSLISGGALGNLIDRLAAGSVVDFIDVHIGARHWPAFNLADSAITTGVIASIIFMYIKEKKGAAPSKRD